MRIVSTICRSEVARARVLAASVAEHAPEVSVTVLVLDATAEDRGSPEPFELLRPEDVAIDDIGTLAVMLEREELREACKPRLLRHMLAVAPGEVLLHLDADSLVCGPLEDLGRLASEHGVLVRRRISRGLPADGRRPNEADLRGWGMHDSGLFALGRGRDHAELLDWWAARGSLGTLFDGTTAPIDRIALLGDGAFELADEGLGASFFDLHDRAITAYEDTILIDGSPLRLMRFPGFDVDDPLALSFAQSRIRVAEHPALAALCSDYAQRLLGAGEAEDRQVRYGFDRLPDGTLLDHRLRKICRRAVKEGGLRRSPFTRWGMEELYQWLGAVVGAGAAFGLNRLCLMVRDEHPELRDAYPDVDDPEQARGLIEWLHVNGVRVGTLPETVIPPTTALERETERRRREFELRFGVNVAGYLTAELGIGEAARLAVAALDAAEVPLLPVVPPTAPGSRQRHPYTAMPTSAAAFPINLICVNADGLPGFCEDVGGAFLDHRYNIGLWWWEVDAFPDEWLDSFSLLDEVWVGTDHVARALAPVSPVPVYTVRFPIVSHRSEPLPRAALGLEDEWVFLSMFDHGSVLERKNPLGTIAAFADAFAPDSGAVLVLKSSQAERDPIGRARVRAAAAPHPHVRLVEGYLSPTNARALVATADCFVSLHRAEGFGLGPAEAMALGKPVIATRYSGNLDFMTDANSYLVDYTLTEIGPGCWPYPEEARWAQVDLGHAARLMREVFEDQRAARARGAAAAASVGATHSLEQSGQSMRVRLERAFGDCRPEPFLPVPEFDVSLTLGRRGRMLRRIAPGVFAKAEREIERLWSANEQRQFDLRAATRGTMLSTQAATLAALRRIEAQAEEPAGEPDRSERAARLDWRAR
jgi:glycosyltransferase involved in cell wall biosynthesis